MSLNKSISIAILSTILFVVYPLKSNADGFTGTEFLTWDRAAQDNYLQTSITMAGVIATQTRPNVASCIDDWYFAGDAVRKQRNDAIRKTIQDNPGYHPSGVLLAVLQKECGSFK